MELYIAKLIGIYFIIVSLISIIRQKTMIPIMKDLLLNRSLLFALGAIELAAGISIVIHYPVVSLTLPGLVSLIGYMVIIEGIFYLATPTKTIKRLITPFNRPSWYVAGGLLGLVIGIALTVAGFGLV